MTILLWRNIPKMSERPNNVVSIEEWVNRRDPEEIKKRLAQIGLEQLLLASEKNRLARELEQINLHTRPQE